jgi:hypothetical protein
VLRAWTTTSWPCSMSACAAQRRPARAPPVLAAEHEFGRIEKGRLEASLSDQTGWLRPLGGVPNEEVAVRKRKDERARCRTRSRWAWQRRAQALFGWNDAAMQTNATKVTFTNKHVEALDSSWSCANGETDHSIYSGTAIRPLSATPLKNKQGKVTDWTLSGFSGDAGAPVSTRPARCPTPARTTALPTTAAPVHLHRHGRRASHRRRQDLRPAGDPGRLNHPHHSTAPRLTQPGAMHAATSFLVAPLDPAPKRGVDSFRRPEAGPRRGRLPVTVLPAKASVEMAAAGMSRFAVSHRR